MKKAFFITRKEWTFYKSTYGRAEKRGGLVICRKEWTQIQGKYSQEDTEDKRRLC